MTLVHDASGSILHPARAGTGRVLLVDELGALDALFAPDTVLVALRADPLPGHEVAALTSRVGRSIRALLPIDVEREDVAARLELPASSVASARIVEAIGLFADLTGAEEVGLRLAVEDRPSCPRFHVDRVALRAVCVWAGPCTEWVDDSEVLDRQKLGHGARGLPDERSGLLREGAVVHSLPLASLAFFKGEAWPGMAGRGLVHRSPDCRGAVRVMWTLDAVG